MFGFLITSQRISGVNLDACSLLFQPQSSQIRIHEPRLLVFDYKTDANGTESDRCNTANDSITIDETLLFPLYLQQVHDHHVFTAHLEMIGVGVVLDSLNLFKVFEKHGIKIIKLVV